MNHASRNHQFHHLYLSEKSAQIHQSALFGHEFHDERSQFRLLLRRSRRGHPAFKIHSSLNATNAQYSNNTTVLNKFSTAWDVADDMIDKLVSDLAQAPALKGLSDTNLSTLNTQGDVIYSGAEAIIQSLNGKYDSNYLFNGADTQNPPFALEQDGDRTYVTYRGSPD